MQLGDKKLIVQRASVGAKSSQNNATAIAPVTIQVLMQYNISIMNNNPYHLFSPIPTHLKSNCYP